MNTDPKNFAGFPISQGKLFLVRVQVGRQKPTGGRATKKTNKLTPPDTVGPTPTKHPHMRPKDAYMTVHMYACLYVCYYTAEWVDMIAGLGGESRATNRPFKKNNC